MGFLTGLDAIDRYGGLRGGLVYILEEPGAGGREFSFNVLLRNRDHPKRIITFTKSEEEIVRELGDVCPDLKDINLGENGIEIISLERFYFWDSIVPRKWIGEEDFTIFDLKREGEVVHEFIKVFDNIEKESIVVIDSITDLYRASQEEIEQNEFLNLVIGLRKLSVRNNLLIFGILTKNVIEKNIENQILADSDGIIVFEWESLRGMAVRWMHFRKLIGLMPFLEREKISKLQIKIDPIAGFVVSQYERVV